MPDFPRSYTRFQQAGSTDTLPEPDPDFWEGVSATYDSVHADTITYPQLRDSRMHEQLVEALVELGEDRGEFLWHSQYSASGAQLDPTALWRAVERQQRAGNLGDLPATYAEYRQQFIEQDTVRLRRADDRSAQAGLGANLVGGIGGAFTDPFNVMTLPFGGFGGTAARRIGTEVLVNAAIEGAQQPNIARQREQQGRAPLTMEEAALNVAFAGLGAGAFRGVIEGAAPLARALTPNDVQAFFALRRDAEGTRVNPAAVLHDALREFDPQLERLTPLERDSLLVMERELDISQRNPFRENGVAGEAHDALLGEAMARALNDNPFPDRAPRIAAQQPVRVRADGAAPDFVSGDVTDSFMARVRGVESSGDDAARNPRSSATGRYQFTDSTWLAYYKRRYGTGGLSDAQILAKRTDGRIQDVLMRDLTTENANALRRGGEAVTEGNLYLAHFAGPRGALDVLRADPDASVASVLGQHVINANPFLRGKTTDWLVRWAAAHMDVEPPRRGNARIRFDEASELAGAQDALDAAMARADALASQGGIDGAQARRQALVDEAAEWQPVLADFDGRLETDLPPIEGAASPDIDWMMPQLRELVETPGRSINAVESIADDLGATVPEVRAALDYLVESGAVIRRSDGNLQRRPPNPDLPDQSLLDFIAARGGIEDTGGDFAAMGAGSWHRQAPFRRRLLRERTDSGPNLLGMPGSRDNSVDTLFDAAIDAGYFPELMGSRGPDADIEALKPDVAIFHAAVEAELAGNRRFAIDTERGAMMGADEAAMRGMDAEDAEPEIDWRSPTEMQGEFTARLNEIDPRLAAYPDLEPLLFDATLTWMDRGVDPVDALRIEARKRYEDIAARAEAEIGEPLDEALPGWEPLTDEEFADFFARYEGEPQPAPGGARSAREQGAARGRGQDRASDAEIGQQLARTPEAERTPFADPAGPAAREQADSLAHDAKMEADAEAMRALSREVHEIGLAKKRPSDAQFLQILNAERPFDGGFARSIQSTLHDLERRAGIKISESNIGKLGDEVNELLDGGVGHAEFERFIAAHREGMAPAEMVVRDMDPGDYYKGGPTAQWDGDTVQFNSSGVDLVFGVNGDVLELKMIRSDTRGMGSFRMAELVNAADEAGATIVLYAKGFDEVPTSKLVNWYERYGFENTDGRVPTKAEEADPDHQGVDMERQPGASWKLPGDEPTLDLGDSIDPNIAARQRQEAQLGAEGPMRATAEQDGTMGLPMFDAADQPQFRLDVEGEPTDMRGLLDDIEAEEAELKAIRDCL